MREENNPMQPKNAAFQKYLCICQHFNRFPLIISVHVNISSHHYFQL